MYHITPYTKHRAQLLGVEVKPASNQSKKKIDVYKKGHKIASIGAKGYGDYPTYLQTKNKTFADERRRLYKIRHEKDRKIKGTPGYFSDQLLW
jgi:hypothetical protein